MHHELAKGLYDVYPLEEKNDFFPAFLYMKYIENFIWHAFQASGLPVKEPRQKVPEEIDAMLKFYVQQIADSSATTETNIYHGKVVKLQDAIKLVTQKKDLHLVPSEKVMPYKLAREVILKSNSPVAVGTCVCRSLSETPCMPPPYEACMFVGDPFASFIAEESKMFRKVSQDEAVKILEDVHQKGFVHTAYFKKEMGNRFMAICNCCSCCCVGIRMWNMLEGMVPIMASSGYVAEIGDECNACGSCVDGTCKFNAIRMSEDGQKAIINEAKCMGCGICVDVCPIEAIKLRRDPSKGEPLDIEELQRQPQAA
jgi:Pyruvate/2-oxoacid:ferredoxin oxidoreductase delta subunit